MASEPERVIAIGDLNGAFEVLRAILRGTGLIDRDDRWCGGRAHVIQMGDIFDRGGGRACAAHQLLAELSVQAPESGGRVTMLLGNHEVMAALGDKRWCTSEEYLEFASESERAGWGARIEQARVDLIERHPQLPQEVVGALLESWKRSRAPGRSLLERAMSEAGAIGRSIRTLPIAAQVGDTVFCHAGLLPEWAALGLDGLERERRVAWQRPRVRGNIFHHERGPLWNRLLTLRSEEEIGDELRQSLGHLQAARMVVGHTPTGHVPGGATRTIAMRCERQLVCIDVGLRSGYPGAALVIDERGGHEWRPDGRRSLWSVG